MIDPLINGLLACALALLFGGAALHKLKDAPRFHAQLDAYHLLPSSLVKPAGWLFAGVEAMLALALLWPDPRPYAGAAAVVMLSVYAGAMAINLWRGRTHIDCGCGDSPVLLSPWLLVRNGLLILCAATLILSTSERNLSWADLAMAVVVLPALLLLYRALEQLLENASILREWRMSRD